MPLITVCDSGKDSANPHTRVDRTHIHVHQNTTNTSLSCKQTHIWPCHIIAHKPAYTHTWTSLRKVIEMHSHSQTQAHICKHYTLIYAHMHKQISKHFSTKNTNLLWFGLSSLLYLIYHVDINHFHINKTYWLTAFPFECPNCATPYGHNVTIQLQ